MNIFEGRVEMDNGVRIDWKWGQAGRWEEAAKGGKGGTIGTTVTT